MTSTQTTPTTADTGTQAIDPRIILQRAIATCRSTIANVRPDQLDSPTPCDEMDVRHMIQHLVGVLDRITALGEGRDPFTVLETVAPDDNWSATWDAAAQRVNNAWSDDAVLTQPMALPWIQGSGADILSSYFSEITVHTWDLAVATGQQPEWDDDVVATALAVRDFLPAENRLALFEEISASIGLDEVAIPFAEAVTIPDDAPAIERLVAWNGRDPRG